MFDWKDKTCLVLGGAGWVGSHVVDVLIDRGAKVCVVDNLSVGRKENVTSAEVLERDITVWSGHDASGHMKSYDFIFNAACMDRLKSDRGGSWRRMSWQVNAGAVERLFAELRFRCWLQISTSSVYGSCHDADEYSPFTITSMYAAGKAAADCIVLANRASKNVVIARLSNIYGPRRTKKDEYCQVVNAFVQETLERRRCVVNGRSITRDFVYVDDAAAAIAMLAERLHDKKLLHDVYNISGQVMALDQVWSTVKEAVKSRGVTSLQETYTERHPEENDIESRHVNSDRIRRELGWSPRGFRAGVEATVDWFINNENRWK